MSQRLIAEQSPERPLDPGDLFIEHARFTGRLEIVEHRIREPETGQAEYRAHERDGDAAWDPDDREVTPIRKSDW